MISSVILVMTIFIIIIISITLVIVITRYINHPHRASSAYAGCDECAVHGDQCAGV